MAHRFRLVALTLAGLAFVAPAAAFYVSPTAPPGFAGTPGNWTFAPPSGAQQIDKIIRQSGGSGLRVPTAGSAVTAPVGYRLKAQAARVAAAAIFRHPYVRIGLGIAAWLLASQVSWNDQAQQWESPSGQAVPSTGFQYRFVHGNVVTAWANEAVFACRQAIGQMVGPYLSDSYQWTGVLEGEQCKFVGTQQNGPDATLHYPLEKRVSSCPSGWYHTPAGCVQTPPPAVVTEEDFIERLAPQPMPSTVPGELPTGTPLPVEQPLFNPSPGANPNSRPLFVPTGDPVPNPQYDPLAPPSPTNQPWMQPGVRLVPSPTTTEPWRVDVQPVNRPTESPDPDPEPQPEDDPSNDKPKPEEQQSLCEKHPDIVACAKTGTLEATPVPNQDKQLSITPDTGYGPGSGTCPAPKTASVMGQPLAFKYDLLCDFAGYIKPIVIAFAWLSAALTFFGFSRKDA